MTLLESMAAVLALHRWKTMGVASVECECGDILQGDGSLTRFPADEAFRNHVAEKMAVVARTLIAPAQADRAEFDDDPPEIDAEDSGAKPPVTDASDRVVAFLSWYGDGRIIPEIAAGFEDGEVPLYCRDIEALRQAAVRGVS